MSITLDVHQEMTGPNLGLSRLIAQGDMDSSAALEHCASLLAPRSVTSLGITRITLNDDDKVIIGCNYCVSLDGLTRYDTYDSGAVWWTFTYHVNPEKLGHKDVNGFMLLRYVVAAFSYEYRERGLDSRQLSQQALGLIWPATLL